MKEELISELPKTQNWIFILFLFCFFVYVQLLTKKGLLFAMLNDFFFTKNRQSVFCEKIGNGIVSKLFLSLQTVILFSLAIYCMLLHLFNLKFENSLQLLTNLGVISSFIIAYILYKFLLNVLVSHIFFQKKNILLWNNYFFSIFSLCGLCLFIPVLLIFYLGNIFYFYFVLGCFLFAEILILNKFYMLFFHKKSILHYFILYLYIQTIVPLCLLYKVMIYFTNT